MNFFRNKTFYKEIANKVNTFLKEMEEWRNLTNSAIKKYFDEKSNSIDKKISDEIREYHMRLNDLLIELRKKNELIGSEKFIDQIIERINKKQLQTKIK